MKVSVIVPCFNHGRFVGDAARSVLSQTHEDLELILVDDCSKDDSWQVMLSVARCDPRVKLIRHEVNQGLSRSRNDALRVSAGKLIAFCDADDLWEPEKLAIQIAILNAEPAADVVFGDSYIIDERGVMTGEKFSDIYPLPKRPSGLLLSELLTRNFINIQSAAIRRDCLVTVGEFEEAFSVLEDWWFWLLLSRRHQFAYDARPVGRYRVHGNSLNAMQKPAFSETRVTIFERVLSEFSELSRGEKAHVLYALGAELCASGDVRAGRRRLREAIAKGIADPQALRVVVKAALRLPVAMWSRARV